MKRIRTKTKITGGLSPEELEGMARHSALWVSRAMRTDPIDPEKIIPVIEELYAVSGLAKPKVVIVPSPLVMAFAYGAAVAHVENMRIHTRGNTYDTSYAATLRYHAATNDATRAATDAATRIATEDATRIVTDGATGIATYAATGIATRAATDAATDAAINAATRFVTDAATRVATGIATRAATDAATRAATDAATYAATRIATRAATDADTDAAINAATRFVTDAATRAATGIATRAATDTATRAATDAATYAATGTATYDVTGTATYAATGTATYDVTGTATYDVTGTATYAATGTATYAATRAATLAAVNVITEAATYNAATGVKFETGAAAACFDLAGKIGIAFAAKWSSAYHGGNMWAAWDAYLTSFRDVLGLDIPVYKKYIYWENAAIHGGFRVMHKDFCIVSDFPEFIRIDERNRPHCVNGPSHRWRDGWSLYHWHGVSVPSHWIENKNDLSPEEVISCDNVERRSAGAEIVGWTKMVDKLQRKIIDGDPNTDIGALVELTLPGLPEPGRFLQAICPRNGTIVEGVPRVSEIDGEPINTVIAAQAWRDGLPAKEYQHPLYRT